MPFYKVNVHMDYVLSEYVEADSVEEALQMDQDSVLNNGSSPSYVRDLPNSIWEVYAGSVEAHGESYGGPNLNNQT